MSEQTNTSAKTLEELGKLLNLEKTLDLIQFRSTFLSNFDFGKVRELSANPNSKRTGSRSTSWKVIILNRILQSTFSEVPLA